MFKYDTIHGQYKGSVEGKEDGLYIDGKKIHCFTHMKVGGHAWGRDSREQGEMGRGWEYNLAGLPADRFINLATGLSVARRRPVFDQSGVRFPG